MSDHIVRLQLGDGPTLAWLLCAIYSVAAPVHAATLQQAHDAAVVWFERRRNGDGSWEAST